MVRVLCVLLLFIALNGCADTWVQCEKHLVPINPVDPAQGREAPSAGSGQAGKEAP
jgi:hypothetical protein